MVFSALRYIAEHIKETASTHARQTKVNARRLGLNARDFFLVFSLKLKRIRFAEECFGGVLRWNACGLKAQVGLGS